MSAFLVSDTHLNYLVSYASLHRVSYWDKKAQRRIEVFGEEQAAFNLLFGANVESINERYQENTPPMPSKFLLDAGHFDPVQVIKACNCYDYQACEVDDYEATLAAHLVDAIRSEAIRHLPGYEAAEWGVPERVQGNVISLYDLAKKSRRRSI